MSVVEQSTQKAKQKIIEGELKISSSKWDIKALVKKLIFEWLKDDLVS